MCCVHSCKRRTLAPVLLFAKAESRDIALNHIQPGKHSLKASVEDFYKAYRTELLDCCVSDCLQEVRDIRPMTAG